METKIVKGIVLSSFDYKEKDKLVELFTLELGKITAVLKGCKSPTAKLKFAFQPFCFAEFSVVNTGKFYQIIDAKLIDSFFDLTNDLSTYYLSSLVLELTSISVDFEEPNPKLFISVLNVLKYICYDNLPPYSVTLKFCLELLSSLGYSQNFQKCSECGGAFLSKIYLNLESGEFVCNACKSSSALQISNQAFSLIKIISGTTYDRLNTIKISSSVAKEGILILCKNIEHRLLKIIHTAKFLI